jgi:ribosomal protein S18 acetylase RimI-like enzyme
MGTIRRATSSDQRYLGDLAQEVFAVYGNDYGLMIPAYARDSRVITLIYEEGRQRVGFIQVGFLEAPGNRRDLIADILAVAVTPGHQGQGVGSALFRRVFELLRPMRERGTVKDVQLTVADTNGSATRLFQRLGFSFHDAEYGTYEGGQQAIRMSLGHLPGISKG